MDQEWITLEIDPRSVHAAKAIARRIQRLESRLAPREDLRAWRGKRSAGVR